MDMRYFGGDWRKGGIRIGPAGKKIFYAGHLLSGHISENHGHTDAQQEACGAS